MIKDFEVVMNEIAEIVKESIPVYSAKLAEDKGDTLLEHANTLSSVMDNIYSLWNLSDMAPFSVSFLQAMAADPEVSCLDNCAGVHLRYFIAIMCFVMATGDNLEVVKRERYCRILRDIIKNEIATRFEDVMVEDVSTAIMADQAGASYESCAVTFSLDIVE
jgi:hypothetical protein